MDVITVVMLAIAIIAVLKTFTLTLVFICKCHCTSILSVSALLVDRQYSIIILSTLSLVSLFCPVNPI
jgi:hypothetical protein